MHNMRSAYGKKTPVKIHFTEKSLTKQSFTKECDINTILAKYQKTGAIDHVNKHEAQYGFASSDTFTESMNIVAKGQTMFEELPSSIRTKFENNPAKFLDFVQDESNAKEMQELGLATKKLNNESNPTPAKQSEAQKPQSGGEKNTSESESKDSEK